MLSCNFVLVTLIKLEHFFFVTFSKFSSYIYTSRFAASSCGGPPVAKRPVSFATHAHRKHLKTLISENTLIYSGNQTNAHIHIFLLESNKVVYPCCVTILPLDFKQHYSLKTKSSVSRDAAGTRPIIFSIKSYPLYAQSREPFHTGHGRPFQTNTQTNKHALLV